MRLYSCETYPVKAGYCKKQKIMEKGESIKIDDFVYLYIFKEIIPTYEQIHIYTHSNYLNGNAWQCTGQYKKR